MSTKMKMTLMLLLTVSYLLGVTMYVLMTGMENMQSIILFTLSLGLIVFVSKRFKSYKSGEVLEDEMSVSMRNKAGARAFYASLYLWLVLAYYYDIQSEAVTIGFAGMAVLFAINYAYLNGKGSNVDH